ncbi:MAG TPA: anthranilate synthase component I family protein [Kofleriaceae bacterium]|nr:anthranilate synthase component I family protein [Kofleriaceae bacterium]
MKPLDACARLAGRPGRFLLHSASDADGLGGWSFAGSDPIDVLEDGSFAQIEAFCRAHGHDLRSWHARDPVPRVIGWIDYEGGGWLGAYDAIARWRGDELELIGAGAPALARCLELGSSEPGAPPRFGALDAPDDGEGGAAYLARALRILEYLRAGDVYQVNLARRLVAPLIARGDAFAIHRALVSASPAPYSAFLETSRATIVSSSPERFLARAPGGRIETRPIKGTRPRGASAADDLVAKEDLLAAPKDAAEHLMIVDLERNDLGRVAVTGSVAVDEMAYVVELPTVHHLVSRVSAALRPDVGLAELLRATFPGGSITGAPKIRAMQIIRELEPAPRGPYCGAIGWFGDGGALDLSIAIRIAVLDDAAITLHVGGGIVADSDPHAELAETEAKAAGWRRALAMLSSSSSGAP